ncbi:MAG: hypothetical protein EXS12_08785 [Phycisphaerales bacterium]|nr:hypothetical protein [Phycisphaerales bacterium]
MSRTIQRVSITMAISVAACSQVAMAGFVNTTEAGQNKLFLHNNAAPLLTMKVSDTTFNTQLKRPSTDLYSNKVLRRVFAQDNDQFNVSDNSLPNDLAMTSIPAPGAVALFGLVGLVNSRRRRN